MPVPSSAKFDIFDWNIRATETANYLTDAQLSDSVEPITQYAFIPNTNTVTADGFTTLVANARDNSSNTVVSSVLQVSDALTVPIPENFTFEFDVYLPDEDTSGDTPIRQIPLNFNKPDNRLFIGAINQQGYTAGFLFSYDGIALASYPEDPYPTVLGGSKKHLFNDDGSFINGVNIRAVIDGENGRIAIYIASSFSAYAFDPHITEAGIKYNLAAKKSTGEFNDSVYLKASAPTALGLGSEHTFGETAILTIGSLRLSSYKVLPEDRPIADAYTAYQTVVGTTLPLVGSKSYDPTGKNITYNWELDVAPDESTAYLQGATYSTADIEVDDPNSQDPLTVVVLTYKKPTKYSDGIKVVITEGAPESILSMTWDYPTRILSIVLGADSEGNVTTSALDLVQAFSNTRAAGYDVEVSGGTATLNFSQVISTDQTSTSGETSISHELITYPGIMRADLAIANSSGSEKIEAGTFTFSGGSGSSLMNPVLVPDKPGVYIAYLVVSNGTRSSLPYKLVFSAQITNQLLGHRPNSKYIWKYISDFWDLVPDKTQITSVWSAMTQVVSSDMVTAWQNDYAKAIKDVSRRYQRRWLHYDSKVSLPKGYTAKVVYPESISREDLDISDVRIGSSTSTAIVVNESRAAPFTVGKALLRTTLHPPAVINIVDVKSSAGVSPDTYSWKITASKDSFPSFEIIDQRTGGYFIKDPSLLTQATPPRSVVFDDPTYSLASKVDLGLDTIRVFDSLGKNPQLVKISEVNPGQLSNAVKLVEGSGTGEIEVQVVDGFAREWDHLREAKNIELEQTPYVLFGDEFIINDRLSLSLGDKLSLLVIDPDTSTELEISLPVLSSSGQCVYVEWTSLLDALSMQSIISGEPRVWLAEDLVEISIEPISLSLCRKLNSAKDLVSIPMLGTNSINQDLVENLDFTITDNKIVIKDWFSGTVRTKAGSTILTPDSVVSVHTSLSALYAKYGNLSFLETDTRVEAAQFICLGAGDSGVYQVVSYNEDGSITVDRPLVHTADKLYFWAPKYNAFTPAPDMFWAELSYFDNWKTIENNFGLFIGFPKELVDSYDASLDYLSVTKAIWFAFLSGPHFDNMQLAIQAMFDLPYSEVNGQIRYIEEPTETHDGRFIIEDEDGVSHTYTYPKNAAIADNPATGNRYGALQSPLYWDLIKEDDVYYQSTDGVKVEVSSDVLLEMEDAKVTVYSKLVDVVAIEDYITNPDLITQQFGSNGYTYSDELGNTHFVDQQPSELEKYHKFIVDVPMDITQTTQVFPLVKSFLEEAKPSHTDFILLASSRLADEVSCIDSISNKPTLILGDTAHTSPFWGLDSGTTTWNNTVDSSETQYVVPEAREDLLWPKEKTYERVASIDYSDLLSQALAVDELHGSFTVSVSPYSSNPASPIIFLDLGPSYTYGEVLDSTQMQSATLTDLGNHWMGTPSIVYSIGFYIGDEFFLITTSNSTYIHPGTNTLENGDPIGIRKYLNQSDIGMNLASIEGKVDRFYLFDNSATTMLQNHEPVTTYWDKGDVLEKYESGYREGILDDYAGDGSWNSNRHVLDKVNSLDSDIDVARSRVWVPIEKVTSGSQADLEFELGEAVNIVVGSTPEASIWDDAPPVVLHVGAGIHPKVPGVFSPQAEHPQTYLLLGFDRSDIDGTNDWTERPSTKSYNAYGDESRLDVIKAITDANPGSSINIIGQDSGALGLLKNPLPDNTIAIDRSNPNHIAYPGATPPSSDHYPYFLLETIWQPDKLIEYGPVSDPSFSLSIYLPMDSGAGPYPNSSGGITIENWQKASPTFDGEWLYPGAKFGDIITNITAGGGSGTAPEITTAHDHNLSTNDVVFIWNTDQSTSSGDVKLYGEYAVTVTSLTKFTVPSTPTVLVGTSGYVGHSPLHYEIADRHQKELQQYPFNSSKADNAQFVPSSSPGAYSIWADATTPATTKLTWGYKDEGAVLSTPVNIDAFDLSTTVTTYLQNVHYGMKIRSRKEHHLTHGFTEFFIPPPSIKMVAPSSFGHDIRICGFYFCNDDPTRVNVPTSDPDSYGDPTQSQGTIGGSWVFFRHSITKAEIQVDEYTFEKGTHLDERIILLGKDRNGFPLYVNGGPDQPSDGHIIEIDVPGALPGFGYYDIIVRNYRPYRMSSSGDWKYHMDEGVFSKAFYHSESGWEVSAWGTNPFGGV